MNKSQSPEKQKQHVLKVIFFFFFFSRHAKTPMVERSSFQLFDLLVLRCLVSSYKEKKNTTTRTVSECVLLPGKDVSTNVGKKK